MRLQARRTRIIAISIVAVAVVSCGAEVAPSPTVVISAAPTSPPRASAVASASATVPPVATVPPRPAIAGSIPPEDSLPVSATTEADGVRLTVAVAGNPSYAGDQVRLTTTIENVGDTTIRWTNDGCDENAYVHGEMNVSWPDADAVVAGPLAPYRDWLGEEAGVDAPIWLNVRPAFAIGKRQYGCADLGIGRSLKPGRAVTQDAYWDGQAAPRLGLPPNGPVAWIAEFTGWGRGEEEAGTWVEGPQLSATLDGVIVGGRRSDMLSPGQIIDAALGNDQLASWLVSKPFRSGANAIAEYDRASGLWVVGLITYVDSEYGDPSEGILHAAYVDPITGEVVAIREVPLQL